MTADSETTMITTAGIHHVTGIAGDAQRNVDFYAGVLALRLVKVTVNFDDPHTYHLYYGDGVGSPGSIITFFPWPHAREGRAGVGQVAVTSFSIASGSIGYWLERFVKLGVAHDAPSRRFDETCIAFRDPNGLQLQLVAATGVELRGSWAEGGVPAEHAIHGIHSVTLWENTHEDVERVLMEGFGFRLFGQEEETRRYVPAEGVARGVVDVRAVGGFLPPIPAAGTIHHVAFRAASAEAQLAMREQLVGLGLRPTGVLDRKYFQSVYSREPGGVLFEIATDAPGFAIDEPEESLGRTLQLPPQYESERAMIRSRLPNLNAPMSPPLYQAASQEPNS
jgi:glyoxalase family protein